jgi:hypothetical protein
MTPATAARTPTDLERQLRGWRLATAEITYRLPDHPAGDNVKRATAGTEL